MARARWSRPIGRREIADPGWRAPEPFMGPSGDGLSTTKRMRLGGISEEIRRNVGEGTQASDPDVSARKGEQEPIGAQAVLEGIILLFEGRAALPGARIAGQSVITRPLHHG